MALGRTSRGSRGALPLDHPKLDATGGTPPALPPAFPQSLDPHPPGGVPRLAFRLGVDPGKNGAAVVLKTGFEVVDIFEFAKDGESGFVEFVERLPHGTVALVESVKSSPQMGVVSAFSFGENYGFLRGVLLGAKVPVELALPSQWQAPLRLPKLPKSQQAQHKRNLRDAATRLLPSRRWTLDTCDAALIAAHALRVMP